MSEEPQGEELRGRLEKMRAALAQAHANLEQDTVEVVAGGGSVRLVMSGTQRCKEVKIDPKLAAPGHAELLQDLVLQAVNQAIEDSQLLAASRLAPIEEALKGR
jgi:hypothetical protein